MNLSPAVDLPVSAHSEQRPGAEPRILLHEISWQDYEALGAILRDRPNLRLTYDRGSLEIMTTSPEHERIKERLSRYVQTLAEEFGLEIVPAGNMTFRRQDLERSLEADCCFWIAHEPQMRAVQEWDPKRDPPPDLLVEIEISRSAISRMPLYAALGVPEVWRCDGASLQVHILQPDGTYQKADTSPTFPGIPLAEMILYLQPTETMGFLALVRAFRDWVRQHQTSS